MKNVRCVVVTGNRRDFAVDTHDSLVINILHIMQHNTIQGKSVQRGFNVVIQPQGAAIFTNVKKKNEIIERLRLNLVSGRPFGRSTETNKDYIIYYLLLLIYQKRIGENKSMSICEN